eukprot:2836820-Pyramimonas_sp.AAC.1
MRPPGGPKEAPQRQPIGLQYKTLKQASKASRGPRRYPSRPSHASRTPLTPSPGTVAGCTEGLSVALHVPSDCVYQRGMSEALEKCFGRVRRHLETGWCFQDLCAFRVNSSFLFLSHPC